MAVNFDLQRLRRDIRTSKRSLRITSHAQIEAFKDGLLLSDLRHVFEQGEAIEVYPSEHRWLLFARLLEADMPVHIVVEDTPNEGVIITAYVPDSRKWIADKRRR
ncbi:MAG: DUF4258 domain-containing protein [Caldilineaceae bacterium]|nr:DUF4258 domain-containing protein [Caldilineaceae bacterium]MBP8106207.1 DUF4258 domain-containing protein [Caldilineaceae bacterium]MBP8121138.1 DUF4258 domain-containing protein [Caldilineaceae bacterium]MBP9071531.1 DUF4258 domain-containing protein [Caldilineaceae bacterium]